jgi:hypothetical protein
MGVKSFAEIVRISPKDPSEFVVLSDWLKK